MLPSCITPDWHIALLLALGLSVVYTLRINVSVAVIPMADTFDWNEDQRALVLSSFYIGYTAGQLPSSLICKMYKQHLVLLYTASIFLPALLTFLTPLVAKDFNMMLFFRVLTGLFESTTFPSIYEFFLVLNSHPEKRTKIISTVMSGIYLGTVLGFLFSGILIETDIIVKDPDGHTRNVGGWPSLFYVFGLVGMVYCVFFYFTAPKLDDVRTHNTSSYAHAYEGITASPAKTGTVMAIIYDVPWLAFITEKMSLTLLLGGYVYGWLGYLIMSELPTFMVDVLHLNPSEAADMSTVVFTCMLIATPTVGRLSAYLQTEHDWSTLSVRRAAQITAFAGSCVFLIGAAYAAGMPSLSIACLALSQVALSAQQSGLACSYLEIAGEYSGVLNTLSNLFTSVGGILSPLFVAACQKAYNSPAETWQAIFLFSSAKSALALGAYVCIYRPELVPSLSEGRCHGSDGSTIHHLDDTYSPIDAALIKRDVGAHA